MAWPTSGFPTSLDTITDKVDGVDYPVANDINGAYDCIEKMQAKIGVNGSAVATSLDYLLKNTSSVDPGHKHTMSSLTTGWAAVTAFVATPASTSTLTMTSDLSATLTVGTPIKYTIGGTVYYGVVSAITSGLLTVAGPPMGGDVTALYYGDKTQVQQVVVMVPGLYEDASSTGLIAADLNSSLVWEKGTAYCVRYRVYSKVHDTGSHGSASVLINGTELNTSAGGLVIAADATWYSTVVDIASAAYDINPGEAIEITSTKAGNGDATDLTVSMTFVTP